MLIAFHKPYGVVSQFTESGERWRTLKEFAFPRGVYPIGRLDADSEGLILLSDEGQLVDALLNPRYAHQRLYWAQVEGIPDADAFAKLEAGVKIGDYITKAARAWMLDPQPQPPPRDPPIRARKTVPDCWIALALTEGRNHQVRRMTASVGHPTLRLIRVRIGDLELGELPAGQWRELGIEDRHLLLAGADHLTASRIPKRRIAPPRRRRQSPPR